MAKNKAAKVSLPFILIPKNNSTRLQGRSYYWNLITASRILSAWEQQGIIEGGRERVLIRRPDDLFAIAEDLPPMPR